MKRLAILALIPLAGCAAAGPYAPVDDVHYTALGHDPFWMVTIGDDSIVLALGADSTLEEHRWPRVLPRTDGDVMRWESGSGTDVISVEARPGPCTGSKGATYEDHVRVRLSGRELSGCGGRLLSRGRG